MADYITRAKNITANVKNKDLIVPSNSFLKALGEAFVYDKPANWKGFLESPKQLVVPVTPDEKVTVNPANIFVPTDIGILNANTHVFTPVTNGDKNKLMSIFFIRQLRSFAREKLVRYRRKITELTSGDSGKLLDTVIGDIQTAALSESLTELGDQSNDPEA